MLRATALAFVLGLGAQHAVAAESLCPRRPPLPEGADELRMQESEFTLPRALKSVEFLRTDFAKRIWGPNAVHDFGAWSGHYISYANSLQLIQGALLRQQVLLERARQEYLASVDPRSPRAQQAARSLQDAIQSFCDFLRSAEYVD